MQKQKRILICPLNWGLGHATRCIPIIRLLLQKNANITIATDGRALELLKQEFPELKFIHLQGYDVEYPIWGPMILKIVVAIPQIIKRIKEEHALLDKLIDEHSIDVVISDNRYGCWNKKVKSIFITHQLMLKSPIGEKMLHKKILRYIADYDECWIPDYEGATNLSGELAHKYEVQKNTFFVGALSRFDTTTKPDETNEYDVMAIISGPEPQRTLFENLIINQLKQTDLKALVVCGKTELGCNKKNIGKIDIVSHLKTTEMLQAICSSALIIARSGYSTVMDLASIGKKAIFIPTPGQTEQEYLANLFTEKKIAFSQTQYAFNLKDALKKSKKYSGFERIESNKELENRIDLLFH